MSLADILSALLAYGILHMRGVAGAAGWRWLFLIEVRHFNLFKKSPTIIWRYLLYNIKLTSIKGGFTLIIGLLAFGLMPAGPCQTSGWLRGKNGWFNER